MSGKDGEDLHVNGILSRRRNLGVVTANK